MPGTANVLTIMMRTAVRKARLNNHALVTMNKINNPKEAQLYRDYRDADMRKARALRSAIRRIGHG